MKLIPNICMLVLAFVLAGCAGQQRSPIALDQTFWNPEGKRIGIAMTNAPQGDVYLPGAACLLCMAAAEAANSSLSNHVETLVPDDLSPLKEEAAKALRKKGFEVEIIQKPIDLSFMTKLKTKDPQIPEYNFSHYATQNQLTHLVLFDIKMLGITRSYANYFPTSDPAGYFSGYAYMIDLKNNKYVWYLPVEIRAPSEDENWDEAPDFPSLTNAYYQAIGLGKDQMLHPLQN